MGKSKRITIPSSVRQYVFERDGYRCQGCGKSNHEAKLTIDHIIALAQGGPDDISNYQTLCLTCNQQKKHRIDPRFQRRFNF